MIRRKKNTKSKDGDVVDDDNDETDSEPPPAKRSRSSLSGNQVLGSAICFFCDKEGIFVDSIALAETMVYIEDNVEKNRDEIVHTINVYSKILRISFV